MFITGTPAQAAVAYSHGDPTPEEQLMLELVNRARANPAAEAARFGIDLNEGIATNLISPTPKQPLAFNADIIQAARAHSQWMLDNDIFAHIETDGSDPGSRMRAAGYVFNGNWTYGENIAFSGNTVPPPVGPTVVQEHQDLFVDSGIEDRGHRRNLMNPGYREIGVGVKTGIFTQNGTGYNAVMATQDFAASDANPGPFLLGVVYKDANADGAYGVGEGLSGVTVTPQGGNVYALSSTSGGYAIPVTGLSGTLNVTFSGGVLSSPITKTVILTGQNVKLDFEFHADTAPKLSFAHGSAHFSSGHFQADIQGPVGIRVSIRSSPDLQSWTELRQVTLTGGSAHFTDNSTSPSYQFYRLVQL